MLLLITASYHLFSKLVMVNLLQVSLIFGCVSSFRAIAWIAILGQINFKYVAITSYFYP